MPKYPGPNQAALLNANTQKFLWNTETAVQGQASIAFQLERQKSAAYPFGVSYELLFSGTPGAFQLEIQHADSDVEENYVMMVTQSSVNTNNAARIELPSMYAKFVRGRLVSLTNS